jgi:hypothetical protein
MLYQKKETALNVSLISFSCSLPHVDLEIQPLVLGLDLQVAVNQQTRTGTAHHDFSPESNNKKCLQQKF